MKRVFLAGAALLMSASALADECNNATTQLELNTCSAQQYQAADKKLNETYQAAIKRAAAPQRDLLKKAQQAWISLRDADCAFIGFGYGRRERSANDCEPVSGGKNRGARSVSGHADAV